MAHMRHPFDLAEVKDGNDLIQFFKTAEESMRDKTPSLKIDGTNVTFKLVDVRDHNGEPTGQKEFAGDRSSKTNPLDIEGFTTDQVKDRFPKLQKDLETGELKSHGMIKNYTILLTIFNEALRSRKEEENIIPELQVLGMYNDPTLIFNAEYVSKGKTNVLEYENNFLALHNLGQIYESYSNKGNKLRDGAERPDVRDPKTGELKPLGDFAKNVELTGEQTEALESLRIKVDRVASNHDFKVYGSIPVRSKELSSIDFSKPL